MSIADKIRNSKQVTWATVSCPEWSTDESETVIHVRSMTGAQRNELERMVSKDAKQIKRDPFIFTEYVLRACCFDGQDGAAVFEAFTTAELRDLHPAPRNRLMDVALKLSGLSDKDVEDIVGN